MSRAIAHAADMCSGEVHLDFPSPVTSAATRVTGAAGPPVPNCPGWTQEGAYLGPNRPVHG